MLPRWVPVSGYEQTYEVSNDGRVRRRKGFWCTTDRELAQHMSNSGYLRVCLSTRGNRSPTKTLVHRLVFAHFVGRIPQGRTVNHKNGRKTDNRASNLELMTQSQQMLHAYATGLQKRARGTERGRVAKLTPEQVKQIRSDYQWRTVTGKQLSERYGVSAACIWKIVRGDTWSHI